MIIALIILSLAFIILLVLYVEKIHSCRTWKGVVKDRDATIEKLRKMYDHK